MEPLLDLELLRTFCEVVKAGELKKAAAAVFRSQAAVSMQIKRLEEQLGARLLERSNQGIQLTPAGETLLDYSEQFLRLNARTLAALSLEQLSGKMSFGIPTDYAQDFLHSFMPALTQALPQLEPRISCARSRNLRQMVERGELDVAIVSGEPQLTHEMLLWTERLIWSAPVGVPLEQQDKLPVGLFEDNCIVRDLCVADLKRAGLPWQAVFTSPVMENIAAAVHAGMAVSLLPESLLRNIRSRPLSADKVHSSHLLHINLIWSPSIDPAVLERLADCMRQAAAQLNRQ
ncbi:LysR family transcriptional regulator [Marinobacterium rhizophilum]|uniref:LysR family transcriptional regulator n=1 Tax=Marinobacterium rhizophilum TaxID=420402 RepID=A0ABY5HLB1_9GAMM|nr:LysR family transcriptional regulator [Marinobacterium rhizophilum]UTW13088.1 LysR family transcriptional regulator [Marinobacterium rhizophilum]